MMTEIDHGIVTVILAGALMLLRVPAVPRISNEFVISNVPVPRSSTASGAATFEFSELTVVKFMFNAVGPDAKLIT